MKKYNIEPYHDTKYREDAYIRAQKRLKELKGFYWHLFWYIAINLFITINKISRNLSIGETFEDAFFDFGTFAIWIFWGIGIIFHAANVFGKNLMFSKDWEKRKIQEFINKEEKQGWE